MRFFHNQDDIVFKRFLNISRMKIPMLRAEYRFQIFVKLLSGETIAIDVRSSNSIREVQVWSRNMLEPDQREIYRSRCYLTFQSKVLRSDFKLSDYNIQKNDTIRQNARLLGGGKRGRASANEEVIPRFIGVPQVKDL